jgi:A/G-specific adenine glycosylase
VGDYTAAAIASIAFGEAVAVVDGNVERVVTRVAGLLPAPGKAAQIASRRIRKVADGLLDSARPADFNQAMMELGATVCLPRNPVCLQCPVFPQCRTRGEHPAPSARKMRSVRIAYALVQRITRRKGVEVILEQRPAKQAIMPGMWELPPVDPDEHLHPSRELLAVRHSITQTNYYATITKYSPEEFKGLAGKRETRRWVAATELESLPLTGLARKVLKRLAILPSLKI